MKRFVSVLLLMSGLVAAGGADAAVDLSIVQSGNDVLITSSGTINTGVCTSTSNTVSASSGIGPSSKTLAFGATGSGQTYCATTITPPPALGSGGFTNSSSNSGASFYLYPSGFWGPLNFTSSTSFSGTQTFSNNTLSGMGLTVGSYVFTLTNGGTSDTFTVNVSAPSAVPTLSEWGQLMLALMVIGIAWHFHNKDQNSY